MSLLEILHRLSPARFLPVPSALGSTKASRFAEMLSSSGRLNVVQQRSAQRGPTASFTKVAGACVHIVPVRSFCRDGYSVPAVKADADGNISDHISEAPAIEDFEER